MTVILSQTETPKDPPLLKRLVQKSRNPNLKNCFDLNQLSRVLFKVPGVLCVLGAPGVCESLFFQTEPRVQAEMEVLSGHQRRPHRSCRVDIGKADVHARVLAQEQRVPHQKI